MYRPNEMAQMTTPLTVLSPVTKYELGVPVKTYEEVAVILCNMKTYGGTEKLVNDLIAVEDTAQITTWFHPAIKANCIVRTQDGIKYEILGTPENIEMRNQVMKFKVRRISGGA